MGSWFVRRALFGSTEPDPEVVRTNRQIGGSLAPNRSSESDEHQPTNGGEGSKGT